MTEYETIHKTLKLNKSSVKVSYLVPKKDYDDDLYFTLVAILCTCWFACLLFLITLVTICNSENRVVKTAVLVCNQINSELTKKQCVDTYKAGIKLFEEKQGVKIKITRIIYKRKLWSTQYRDTYTTLYQLYQFLLLRDYDKYDFHFGIFSREEVNFGFSAFLGNKVCVKGVAGITANNKFFKSYFPGFVLRVDHETSHLAGGIHPSNQDFEPVKLKNDIATCFLKGLSNP